jgi:hypothetical protein
VQDQSDDTPGSNGVSGDRRTRPVAPAESFWLGVAPVALAAATYAWLVAVGFQDDDLLHLYNLATLGAFRFVLLPHGGHPHAFRNLVLVAMHRLFGLHSEWFMLCVLLTHLLNVVLCYRVGVRLTRDPYVASIAAALWGVSRTSSATLGSYAVYGQVLATTALGAVLLLVTRRTDEHRNVGPGTVLACVVLSWAGAFCFGVGLGVALALPVIVALLAPDVLERRSTWPALAAAPLGAVGLYFGYRALGVHYLGANVDPLPHTVKLARFWEVNAALLSHIVQLGPTKLLSPLVGGLPLPFPTGVLLILALVAAMILRERRASVPALRRMAALAVCALSIYLTIALGRGYQGAKAMDAPRYHYAAQFSIALLLAVGVARLASTVGVAWRRGAVMAVVSVLAVAVPRWPSPPSTAYTSSRLAELRRSIETAARAVPPGQTVYVRNRPVPQAGWLVGVDSPAFPGLAGFFCILFPENVVDGRAVRFVEVNRAVRDAAAQRPRIAGLLVDAAPPSAVVR